MIVCSQHARDLASLRHFVEDHRPDVDLSAVATIRALQCPACIERYRAAEAVVRTDPGGERLACSCCGTTWTVEGEGWAAEVGQGLALVGEGATLPTGVVIDSSSWRIAVFDPQRVIAQILRTELFETPDLGIGLDLRVEAAIEDLLEGVDAASRGDADEGAEVYRSVTENALDPVVSRAIEKAAMAVLAEIHRLLDEEPDPTATEAGARTFAISDERFEQFVREALDSLPVIFGDQLQNLAVTVRDRSRDRDALGIYHGVPLTKRSRDFDHLDVIVIYKDEICEECETEQEVREMVHETVLHEVGHHFGIDDRRLEELGY